MRTSVLRGGTRVPASTALFGRRVASFPRQKNTRVHQWRRRGRLSPRSPLRALEANANGSEVYDDLEGVACSNPFADLLDVKTVREHLEPRNHPFIGNPDLDSGFVADGDLVNLQTVSFETDRSNGNIGATTSFDDDDYALPKWGIRAGPRRKIYYEPTEVTAAIVTAGGICPGINFVIHNIVKTLNAYGVPEEQVLGIRYGFKGLAERIRPMVLTPKAVQAAHSEGGSILGTSRFTGGVDKIVKRMKLWDLSMLFVIGGREAHETAGKIQEECERQNLPCAVVSVPKSMDNGILTVDRSFGFDSAVMEAKHPLMAAKVEASSARNGIGLVKLMGKTSGFVAMGAAMASGAVDVCLIPEVPFTMEKLCQHVGSIMKEKSHCVICVAEGAGAAIVGDGADAVNWDSEDADIGTYIKDALAEFFEDKGGADIKYIDPTYMIRAGDASNTDNIYCKVLGQASVHSAFAGYTGVTVGMVNTHYVLLPSDRISETARLVNPEGRRWNRLKLAIKQPSLIDDETATNGANGSSPHFL